jgi:hypothetical protein
MMATARSIKSLGNRGRWNNEATHGRVGRPKDREHMGVVRGFFFIIFSELTGRVVYKGTSEVR